MASWNLTDRYALHANVRTGAVVLEQAIMPLGHPGGGLLVMYRHRGPGSGTVGLHSEMILPPATANAIASIHFQKQTGIAVPRRPVLRR